MSAERRDSRERILQGATEEFAAAGFAGARIDRISRRTRLNVRMIYYHFGSKRGLYRAVLESIYEEAVKILEVTGHEADPTLAALGMYFDLLTSHPQFADVLVRELLDGAHHLEALFKDRPELFERVHEHARRIIEGAIGGGLLAPVNPGLTVFSLTSIVCFLTAVRPTLGIFAPGKAPTPEAWKAHLFTLFFEGLRRR